VKKDANNFYSRKKGEGEKREEKRSKRSCLQYSIFSGKGGRRGELNESDPVVHVKGGISCFDSKIDYRKRIILFFGEGVHSRGVFIKDK